MLLLKIYFVAQNNDNKCFFQTTELLNLSVAIAHFLNCFLYSSIVPNPVQGVDEVCIIYFSHDFIRNNLIEKNIRQNFCVNNFKLKLEKPSCCKYFLKNK